MGLFFIVSQLFLLAACEQKSINQILADPQRYANREVGVVGNVVQRAGSPGRAHA